MAAVSSLLLGLCLIFGVGCDRQPNGSSQPSNSTFISASESRQQTDEYNRQMAMSLRQLNETERQLTESDRNQREAAIHNKRFEALLDRWDQETDRMHALLIRWEELANLVENRLHDDP